MDGGSKPAQNEFNLSAKAVFRDSTLRKKRKKSFRKAGELGRVWHISFIFCPFNTVVEISLTPFSTLVKTEMQDDLSQGVLQYF